MSGIRMSFDDAVDLTRSGDLWLFRGSKANDRVVHLTTNSPVNHVGMALVLDDLPPLLWHAELSRSLPDLWSGNHHRGAQLHDLRAAVLTWANRYHHRVWLRQLDPPATQEMEDSALRTVARLDGTPFPSTSRLASRWLLGQLPVPRWRQVPEADLETAYCAEVVAVTYQAMGLLPRDDRPNWYDPGRFWSGDDLNLPRGVRLGGEIALDVPPGLPARPGDQRQAGGDQQGLGAGGPGAAPAAGTALLAEHVARFNAGVRGGDFGPMVAAFTDDAELAFEGIPVGPFRGREAIAAAYREQPPDDEIEVLRAEEDQLGVVTAAYAWRRRPGLPAGELLLEPRDGRIARLVIRYGDDGREPG